MRSINSKIWSHHSKETNKKYPLKDVLTSMPTEIGSFRELVRTVAELSFHNPEQVLFFRGQKREFWKKTKDGQRVNSFYPPIYRSHGQSLTEDEIKNRFNTLDEYANKLHRLLREKRIQGHEKLTKFPELIWAILQHYEVCSTPLLDVTHSLRVAASFALNDVNSEGFLYVFGFPHPNGSITYSVEYELINIRLLSICPPEAQRPYFQEGFLVGSFPSRQLRKQSNFDVGVRLIAKFKLMARSFWDKHFHAIPSEALFPKNDLIQEVCKTLKCPNERDITSTLTRTPRKRGVS
jgi:hypothetical protein